jgi:hypothetical protein
MMKPKIGVGALALFASLATLRAYAAEPVLHYEPAVTQLSGTVQLERHYGPPNYGASPLSDAVLNVPVLVLDAPVTVQGNPPDPRGGLALDGTTYPDVARVQMTFAIPGINVRSLAGRHVTVEGKLFEKVSAQNFTDVVMDVQGLAPSIRAAP